MGKSFIILPFISSIFMFLGALVTIASFPCPWAFANVSNADVKYSFYLLSWTTDACTNSDGSRYRYSYGDSYEFQDLKSSGIVALVVLLIGVVFAVFTGVAYLLQSIGFTRKLLEPMKLAIKRKTWILLIAGVITLVINICGMILWLALFFAYNISEWLAQDSPNPYIGFYLELVSIILLAVSILVAMFWKSA